ncbi:MAG: FKBP-type peptidyl-prolyl cis-trans isomerase [Holophaga sp.]|nr:FKBP-type peptidyl-prolyl cis-trans isomerase [Holophaga sp.]
MTGDIVVMNYRATLPDGTEVLNSINGLTPRSVRMGEGQLLPGWEQGLTMMKAGGKARMILPPTLAFGATPPEGIPADSSLVLEVELVKVMPVPVAQTVDIKAYKKNPSGLLFYDLVVGTGRVALNSTFVTTRYTMWKKGVMDNTYLSSSEGDSPVFFQVGKGSTVIAGWNEGVIGMKVGGIRQLLIEPSLAYGTAGSAIVPPNTSLLMEIELVDVKEPIKQTVIDEFNYTTTESGLRIYEIQSGVGENPQPGQTVVVHYSGWLVDGTQFDSSYFRGQPFQFVLGAGQVIKGWEEGIAGMRVGGKRKLVIPPELGYGEQGAGNAIPPNTILVFEVELLEIRP